MRAEWVQELEGVAKKVIWFHRSHRKDQQRCLLKCPQMCPERTFHPPSRLGSDATGKRTHQLPPRPTTPTVIPGWAAGEQEANPPGAYKEIVPLQVKFRAFTVLQDEHSNVCLSWLGPLKSLHLYLWTFAQTQSRMLRP